MQAWLLEAETFDTGHVPRAMLQLAGPVKVPICRNCYSEIKKRAENPVNGNRFLSGQRGMVVLFLTNPLYVLKWDYTELIFDSSSPGELFYEPCSFLRDKDPLGMFSNGHDASADSRRLCGNAVFYC